MMSQKKGETINGDSAFKEYKRMYYKKLRDGKLRVRFSEKVFKCPFCPESREYGYRDLCKHACRIVRESKSACLKEKAKHLGLQEFLESDFKAPDHMDMETLFEEMTKRNEDLQWFLQHQEMTIEIVNRDVKKQQEKVNKRMKRIISEHEHSKLQFEEHEKDMKKAYVKMEKLADNEKKDKENLQRQIIELQKKLDEKQQTEMESNEMNRAMEVIKNLTGENVEAKKKIELIQAELKEKVEEIQHLEDLNQSLLVKERLSNDELQDARKELISGLKETPSARANIFVKRMGELDAKPFIAAAKRHGSCKSVQDPIKFVSFLENRLRDPDWHPFKVVIGFDEEWEEVLDAEDEELMSIKAEWGDDAYYAAVTALRELNDYNPSGRCPLPELWNKKEKRKASLQEGVEFIMRQLKTKKRKEVVVD